MKTKKLTEKEKIFCDAYIETLNGAESARRAKYPEKNARVVAYELLSKPHIKEHIDKILKQKEKERVASQDEILEFITKVIRGQVQDQMGFETAVKDRVKAAELMGKRYKLFEDNMNMNLSGSIGVQIIDDIK